VKKKKKKKHLREEICEKEGKRTEGGTKEVSDKKRRKKVEVIKVSFAATNSFLILGLCKLSFFFFQHLVRTMIILPYILLYICYMNSKVR
jgi:uncharacterized membrane protein